MPIDKNHITILIWAVLFTVLYIFIGYYIERTDSIYLLSTWSLLFVGYFFIISKSWQENHIYLLLSIGIIFRLCFISTVPNLSDDYFRFIWDGRLTAHGYNPFIYLPSRVPKDILASCNLTPELYEGLNSQNYYSVYPSVTQYISGAACYLFPDNITGSIIFIRTIIILAEVSSCFLIIKLLQHFKLPIGKVLLYVLNPLVIIELTGNLHFEGILIFFLLLFFYLLVKKKHLLAAIPFALSVSTKLIPLVLLPLLLKRLSIKQFIVFSIICIVTIAAAFLPFYSYDMVLNMYDSVELYFQHFEFNASIFYIIRTIGFAAKGYDIIDIAGKVLPLVFIAGLLVLLIKSKIHTEVQLIHTSVYALFIYYALALVVHPWYISLLLVLSIFTQYRFAILWTALIGFTYITYHTVPYKENYWVVFIEYTCVFAFLCFELWQQRKANTIQVY